MFLVFVCLFFFSHRSYPFFHPDSLVDQSLCLTLILLQDGEFPGLIPLIESYLGNVDVDIDTRCTISQYLKLISRRASGEW